ncbi:MAG: hypothetical protein JWO02_2868, partial [Solirubrobacterales bacterium]|nr:hypothetical protein [Solirubrobacterales bacterium]
MTPQSPQEPHADVRTDPVAQARPDVGSGSDVRTFSGASLEDLLPQIRATLGPDAMILGRREGVQGGVGG